MVSFKYIIYIILLATCICGIFYVVPLIFDIYLIKSFFAYSSIINTLIFLLAIIAALL